jgi:hypothetical protein
MGITHGTNMSINEYSYFSPYWHNILPSILHINKTPLV